VINLSDFVKSNWLFILVGAFLVALLTKEMHRRSPGFRRQVDIYTLKLPIVGKILYNSIMARFGRTLSTTFAAGVPLIDSLESVAGATGNVIYSNGVLKVRDQVATGVQLNNAMRGTNLFPSMMLQMTAIGEESGALDDMLAKTADYHEEVVDNMVDNLTSLLEPLIMVVLGVLVGGLLIALPRYQNPTPLAHNAPSPLNLGKTYP